VALFSLNKPHWHNIARIPQHCYPIKVIEYFSIFKPKRGNHYREIRLTNQKGGEQKQKYYYVYYVSKNNLYNSYSRDVVTLLV